MQALIVIVGCIAAAMLVYYIYILMKGDQQ